MTLYLTSTWLLNYTSSRDQGPWQEWQPRGARGRRQAAALQDRRGRLRRHWREDGQDHRGGRGGARGQLMTDVDLNWRGTQSPSKKFPVGCVNSPLPGRGITQPRKNLFEKICTVTLLKYPNGLFYTRFGEYATGMPVRYCVNVILSDFVTLSKLHFFNFRSGTPTSRLPWSWPWNFVLWKRAAPMKNSEPEDFVPDFFSRRPQLFFVTPKDFFNYIFDFNSSFNYQSTIFSA